MRAGQGAVRFQSDIDFAVFLSTRKLASLRRERFTPSVQAMLARHYDNETEKQRLLIGSHQTKEQAA